MHLVSASTRPSLGLAQSEYLEFPHLYKPSKSREAIFDG